MENQANLNQDCGCGCSDGCCTPKKKKVTFGQKFFFL